MTTPSRLWTAITLLAMCCAPLLVSTSAIETGQDASGGQQPVPAQPEPLQVPEEALLETAVPADPRPIDAPQQTEVAADLPPGLSSPSFRPIAESDIAEARKSLRGAVTSVWKFFNGHSQLASDLKPEILWAEQLNELKYDQAPDTAFWKDVLQRETADREGLELDVFRKHRDAVRTLVWTVEAARNEDLEADYREAMTELAGILAATSGQLRAGEAGGLSDVLARLAHMRQAEDLIREVREQYTYSNMLVYVPPGELDAADTEINNPFSVNKVICGSRVRGNGVMTASFQSELVPGSDGAVWQVTVDGKTSSQTSSSRSGVRVRSRNDFEFRSAGRITLSEDGFEVQPFDTNGHLRTTGRSISASQPGLRGRAARNRARSQVSSSSRCAERQAERDVSQAIQQELRGRLQPITQRYNDNVLLPLARLDRRPQDVRIDARDDALQISAVLAADYELGAGRAPEGFFSGDRMKIAVHQSAVNNTGEALAGRTRSLRTVLEDLLPTNEFATATPLSEADADGDDDVRIRFADRSPLRVEFTDGEARFLLAGASYERAGQRYRGMEIAFSYRVTEHGDEQRLTLDTAPTLQHPLRPDGTRPGLGIRDVSLRRVLENVLAKELPSEVAVYDIRMPELVTDSEGLFVSRLSLSDGWAVLEADRDEAVSR